VFEIQYHENVLQQASGPMKRRSVKNNHHLNHRKHSAWTALTPLGCSLLDHITHVPIMYITFCYEAELFKKCPAAPRTDPNGGSGGTLGIGDAADPNAGSITPNDPNKTSKKREPTAIRHHDSELMFS
jgi:hypothetical protein